MTKTSYRWLRFGLFVGTVLLCVSVAASTMLRQTPPQGSTSPGNNAAPPMDGVSLVCLGFVDVEAQVARLASLQSGRIVDIGVKENDTVAAGTSLLKVDDAPFQAKRTQLAKLLQTEEQKREAAKLGIALREKEKALQALGVAHAKDYLATVRERYNKADRSNLPQARVHEYEDGIKKLEQQLKIEEGKVEALQLQVQLAQNQLAQLEAGIAVQEELLRQADQAIADSVLKAPFAGKVLRLRARKGELVGPTFPEPLIEFCPDQPRIIRAEVHQEYASRVRLNIPCRIFDDGDLNASPTTGRVVRIADWFTHRRSILLEPQQLNDVRTLECIIRLEGKTEGLRIGQRVRVFMGTAP